MSDLARLPAILQDTLDAEAQWLATDREKHPRLYTRQWSRYRVCRNIFAAEYPRLDHWLFSNTPKEDVARREELRHLLEAH